jgi:hypothetical protein
MLKNLDKYDIFTIPKTNRMTYRITFLVYLFLFSSLICANAQKLTDVQVTRKLGEIITAANKKKKSGEIDYDMMVYIRERFDSIAAYTTRISELQNRLNVFESNVPKGSEKSCKSMPPLTNIKTTAWTSQNLTQVELFNYFGFTEKEIFEAKSDSAWEQAHINKKAAFCYHKWDTGHNYGILLNVHALTVLRNKLNEQGAEFRFPTADDVKKLNEVARPLKLNALQIYAMNSDPKQTGSSNWKVQTQDLFNFTLPALSYRRNLEDDEWHGGNAASFYCDNPKDPNWNDGLVLAELSANSKFWEFLPGMITSGDYSNIGVYVRLIYSD